MWKHFLPLPKVCSTEALWLRLLFAFTLFYFMPQVMTQTGQPTPVGLARFMDLTWMAKGQFYEAYRGCFHVLLFAYASGRWLAVVLPLLTLLQVLPYTLLNSQGHPHHGYQVLSLALLGLAIAAVATGRGRPGGRGVVETWVLPVVFFVAAARIWHFWLTKAAALWLPLAAAGGGLGGLAVNLAVFCCLALLLCQLLNPRGDAAAEPTERTNAWQLLAGQTAVAGAYLTSVFSKMIKSDGEWLMNCHNVALDFVKTTRQSFYSRLEPQFQIDPPLVSALLDHQWLARAFFAGGLFLEAGLIFAVGNRRVSLVVGVMLVLMHRMIMELMTLTFYTNEAAAAVFFINVPFWIILAQRRFFPGRPGLPLGQ